MRVIDCDQQSSAWFEARLGKVTASRVADLLKVLKNGGYSAERTKYRDQLVVERLTGIVTRSFVSPAMEWGTAMESDALAAYEFLRDVTVEPVGFVLHPNIDDSGASPDGLVGADGLVETKAPTSITHIATIVAGKAPDEYLPQMQWAMACTGRAWCDFVSHDPRMPPELRTFIVRVERDPVAIASLEMAVCSFLEEVRERVALVRACAPGILQVAPVAVGQ